MLEHYFPLIAAGSSMLSAQALKHTIFLLKGTIKITSKDLFTAGGMPSTHSALVAGLTTAIGLIEGFTSSHFEIAFVFSCIVLYDATGIRQAVAKQARIINKIIEKDPQNPCKLSELVGHTPREAFAGVTIGITVTIILYALLPLI
jgi:acid phosphatase family membrane protein YuiD